MLGEIFQFIMFVFLVLFFLQSKFLACCIFACSTYGSQCWTVLHVKESKYKFSATYIWMNGSWSVRSSVAFSVELRIEKSKFLENRKCPLTNILMAKVFSEILSYLSLWIILWRESQFFFLDCLLASLLLLHLSPYSLPFLSPFFFLSTVFFFWVLSCQVHRHFQQGQDEF